MARGTDREPAGWRRRWRRGAAVVVCLFGLPVAGNACAVLSGDRPHWSVARWDSAGLAPDPATTPEAVVQVYAARSWSWRGIVGVHTWIVAKRAGAPAYTRYEVVGWGVRAGRGAVRVSQRVPDGYWAGNRPTVLAHLRGDGVEAVIDRIEAAVATYPAAGAYRIWPGPNSNTFTAYVARAVPELRLDLPPTAVGKDYLPGGALAGRAPSGTGYQLSLLGLLGVMVAVEEGIEVDLLGLTLGVDLEDPALKLPGLGRVGTS